MRKAEKEALFRAVKRSILDGAIESGEINPHGKNKAELAAEFALFFDRWAASGEELVPIPDHTEDLLRRGRIATADGNFEMAALFYATWAEHWLNWLVRALSTRGKVSEAHLSEIVRTVPLRGKLTWLVALLGGKPIAARHVAQIQSMAELRNAFVHYKWKPCTLRNEREEVRRIVEAFAPTLRYLNEYRRKFLKQGASPAIRRHVMLGARRR